jgi:ATP-dependent helicase/nuclease subunit A
MMPHTINARLIEQDQDHRLQALDASQSFIVQAPAGSGKTELLIQRFLTLLTCVKKPEEILAITFTKKAASEMRFRVIKALKNAATEDQPDSAHAKQTWQLARNVLQHDKKYEWNLIQNPNQLRIQTIDSLCSHLTKQLPLLSHFGSQPDIADHPAILYREAVQEVLSHIEGNYEWTQAIAILLLHLDNDLNKLHDLLINLLAKRDQWLSYIHLNSSDAEIKKQLENQLALVVSDSLSSIQTLFPKNIEAELLAIARFAASNIKKPANNSDKIANKLDNENNGNANQIAKEILACQELTSLPGIKPQNKEAWLGLARLLLTKSFSWRKRVDEDLGFPPLKNFKNSQELALHKEFRARLSALIETLTENENLRSALTELFFLPQAHYSDGQWEILQSLLQVLKIVAAQLRLTFQQHGKIDFIENTQAALLALGNDEHPTDLALALDYNIQHILIDEFQDTSFTQYQLLEKLTKGWENHDGRSLFIVGDPMQSIYKFREAEVGLFIRMRSKGMRDIQLTPLTLALNFRSLPSIVDWNNAQFSRIFPSFNDIASGAVTYSPSATHQKHSVLPAEVQAHTSTEMKAHAPVEVETHASAQAAIHIRGFRNASDENETSYSPSFFAEANHIVDIIHSTQTLYPSEKIAILVRSRPHLAKIIPALKKAKIPYRAIDIDPLASRQHIQDLLSLTCALLHPADRIAWLAVLRSPWCGLSLTDLLNLAGNDAQASIYSLLENSEIRKKISADGQKRIEKIFPLLREKIAERERSPLREWVESTWLLLGGPACLHDYSDIDDIQAFFELLSEFSSKHPIINLDKLKEKINRLYASTQDTDASVQIMTIHSAKGLEFDTVILPQLERKNPNDDKPLLLWMDRPLANKQSALLLAPIHAIGSDNDLIYDYISRQQKIKTDYETDRLLYVATTRAKKRLHLTFNVTQNEKGDYRIEAGSFLSKLWPQIEKQAHEIFATHTTDVNSKKDNIIDDDTYDHSGENNSNFIEILDKNKSSRSLQRFISSWDNPIKELAPSPITLHRNKSGFQLIDHTPRLSGTVTHKILQLLTQKGKAWWEKESQDNKKQYIEFLLKQAGVIVSKIKASALTIMRAIENTLADDRGQWILKNHNQAQSEYHLSAIINNKIENFVIDRMFIDENNILWIIDYKMATLSDDDIASFIENEQKKYAEKMQKYRRALSLRHEGEIKMGLYFPALPAWHEWS